MTDMQRTMTLYSMSIHDSNGDVEDYNRVIPLQPSREIQIGEWILTSIELTDDAIYVIKLSHLNPKATARYRENGKTVEEHATSKRPQIDSDAWVFVLPGKRWTTFAGGTVGMSVRIVRDLLAGLADISCGIGHDVELTPVSAQQAFMKDVKSMYRIYSIRLAVNWPNFSWKDYATALTDYADRSEGARVALELTAKKGKGLSKEEGVVSDLDELVTGSHPIISDAEIRGERKKGSGLETLSLKRYSRKLVTRTKKTDDMSNVFLQAARRLFGGHGRHRRRD